MGIEIKDPQGRGATLEVAPGPAEGPLQVSLVIGGPSAPAAWSCTPAAARALAAALVAAAGEAESARESELVTVEARDLLRGDVRDGNRFMTVEAVRADGTNVQVTWTSGAGRSWSQMYDADAAIQLRRRLRPED
ncbi:hypothetical protein ACFWBV_20550 [Streptomyces sp. NPDC060030]|uniref:hypothetical protein n=1 Tax=Streptomyces sp. NPDC060030 TaxID=3347042 RepID=UPI0036B6EA5E